jgi:hypothetical protein
MTRKPDTLATLLLLGGLALAVAVAFAMPALHFRGADKALLGISAWEAVPWATKLKLAFLGAAAAVAFVPRLAPLRAPVVVGAVVMMFMPALAALAAGVLQWTTVRAEIVALSGTRAPWIDPGWGLVVLAAAAMMVVGALIRMARSEAPAAGTA